MIILNEKRYARDALEGSSTNGDVYRTLAVLAKYFYHSEGLRKRRIEKRLLEFLDAAYPAYRFKTDMWTKTAERLAACAGKRPLYVNDGVSVREGELEKINALKSKPDRRVAFSLLCLAKLSLERNPKSDGWVNLPAKDVFKMARVACGRDERDMKIGALYRAGLVGLTKRNDSLSVRVLFIDRGNATKEALFVSDFRELGYEYLRTQGEPYTPCAECGILIRNNRNGTRKYCDECKIPAPMGMKKVLCVKCGKEFTVNSKNNKTKLCGECASLRTLTK